MQAAAMPMHPDLLSFINLPTASVSEELQQTAARRLQESKKVVIEKGKGVLQQSYRTALRPASLSVHCCSAIK